MEWLINVIGPLETKRQLASLAFFQWNVELDGEALLIVLDCVRFPTKEEARSEAQSLLERATLRLAVKAINQIEHAELGSATSKRYADGRRDVTVEAGAAVAVVEYSMVRKTDGTVSYEPNVITLERLYLDYFEDDPTVRRAITHLSNAKTPMVDLYRAFDIVRDDVQGTPYAYRNWGAQGWAVNQQEVGRFTQSAQPDRHGNAIPHSNPMTEAEAFAFMRRVTKSWLLWKVVAKKSSES